MSRGADVERHEVEVLAQAIHDDYVRRRGPETVGPEDADSLAPWESLPESLRASNRSQAADIERKLDAVGCELVSAPRGDVPPVVFDEAEVDVMAELEHERWVHERTAAGWRWGTTRDLESRRSPHLVSWAELPEDVRDLDRDTVREIPRFLARVGFAVVRRPPSS